MLDRIALELMSIEKVDGSTLVELYNQYTVFG